MMRTKAAQVMPPSAKTTPPRRVARARRQTRLSTRAPDPIDWTGVSLQVLEHTPTAIIFSQGDAATSVMFIETGEVRLSVVSQGGKEAVIAVLAQAPFWARAASRDNPGAWRPRPPWLRAPS